MPAAEIRQNTRPTSGTETRQVGRYRKAGASSLLNLSLNHLSRENGSTSVAARHLGHIILTFSR